MVLASVASPHSKRNYAQAFDDLGKFLAVNQEPLSRASLLDYRTQLLDRGLSPSTINVQLSAIRQLVAEARRNGILDSETAASIADIPNIRQQGTRMGNWLNRDQAKKLLAVPDQEKLIGKRDHALLALLIGCGLRRQELAQLKFSDIVEREGRAAIVDLVGKGRRVRTVAIPFWVKQSIDRWTGAADIKDGPLLRPVSKSGKLSKLALGRPVDLVGRRALRQGDRDQELRRPRPAPDLRQVVPEVGRGPRADQVPARALVDSDHRALPRV